MSARTQSLVVGYKKSPLISNINLEIKKGKVLTLIGPNGCGKSTILKTLTKQLEALGGTVYIGKEDYKKQREKQLARQMAMVMTERLKTELLSCKEVVASGRYPYTGTFGILSKEDWEKVDEALNMVQAKDVADRDFNEISDGQRQRIMLARAICQEPQILVLDEPTSFLDMRYKLDILQNIRRLAREKNMAIIMSLHELDLARQVSDNIACIKGDNIDMIATPGEIFAGDYIQKLYGVDKECFDPLTGQMNLCGNKGQPKVFVISGGGCGIPEFYRLQRENIPFAAGILFENDIEYPIAKSLASSVIFEKAFYEISDEKLTQAKEMIDKCDTCICLIDEFGPLNEKNKLLMEYAKKIGKLEWQK